MGTIKRTTILSCSSRKCSFPWVEYADFTVTKDGVSFTTERVAGIGASKEAPTVDVPKERRLEREVTLTFDKDAPEERHALVLTFEGEFELVRGSKHQDYYAHLAFVDPVTGDAELLVFQDGLHRH